jgi:serine/threonine protein kinase
MSPELHQISSQGYYFNVDSWAVGLTMYMMFFQGAHPFVDRKTNNLNMDRLQKGQWQEVKQEDAGFLGQFNPFAVGSQPDEPSIRREMPKNFKFILSSLVTVNPHERMGAWQALHDLLFEDYCKDLPAPPPFRACVDIPPPLQVQAKPARPKQPTNVDSMNRSNSNTSNTANVNSNVNTNNSRNVMMPRRSTESATGSVSSVKERLAE